MQTIPVERSEPRVPEPRDQHGADDAEREAARLALDGTPIERAAMAARAMRRLIEDPDDTRQVFYVGLLVNRRTYPMFLARFTTDDEGARLLRERPAIDSAHVDYDALRALPDTTLGGAYVRFLDANGLDPDLFQPPPGLPEVPAYIAQRMRQVHDLWHVLTGYGPDVSGEVALQAFTWGNTGMASAKVVALAGALKLAGKDPAIVRSVAEGYANGRRARFLASIRVEDHFGRELEDVRRDWRVSAASA